MMKRYIFQVACWLILSPIFSRAQTVSLPFSGIYTGMGTYSKHTADPFSFTFNQASLAHVKQPGGGVYSEQRYMIKELTLYTAVWVSPLKKGAIGWSAHYSGNPFIRYARCAMAYGRSLTDDLDLGIQFNYTRISIPGYFTSQAFTAEAGIMLRITDQLFTGFHLSDISAGLSGRGNNPRPAARYSFGMGYTSSPRLLIKCDLVKEENQPALLLPALQYNMSTQAFIRAGVNTANASYIIGTGLKWKNLRTDVSASYDMRLGISPALLILITP